MPIFSFVVLAIIAFIFIHSQNMHRRYIELLLLYVVLDTAWIRGAFITSLESSDLSFARVVMVVFTMYSIYYAWKVRVHIPRAVLLAAFIYTCVLLMGGMAEIIMPYRGDVLISGNWDSYILGQDAKSMMPDIDIAKFIKSMAKAMMFVIDICIFKAVYRDGDLLYVLKRWLQISVILVVYGYAEYLMKNVFGMADTVTSLMDTIFGISNFTGNAYLVEREGKYTVYGFSTEASAFCIVLYLIAIASLIYNKIRQTAMRHGKHIGYAVFPGYTFVVMFLMTLTMGMSYVVCFAIIVLVYFAMRLDLYNFNKRGMCIFFGGILLVVLAGWGALEWYIAYGDGYTAERLYLSMNVIQNFLDGNTYIAKFDSTLPRFLSIIDGFFTFLDRPLLGVGIGVMPLLHDSTVTMLVSIGILGCLSWSWMVLSRPHTGKRYDIMTFVLFVVIAGIPVGLGNVVYMFSLVFIMETTSLYASHTEGSLEVSPWTR